VRISRESGLCDGIAVPEKRLHLRVANSAFHGDGSRVFTAQSSSKIKVVRRSLSKRLTALGGDAIYAAGVVEPCTKFRRTSRRQRRTTKGAPPRVQQEANHESGHLLQVRGNLLYRTSTDQVRNRHSPHPILGTGEATPCAVVHLSRCASLSSV